MTPLGACPLPRPCPGTDGLRAPHAWSPHTVPVPGRCSLWAQDGSAPETQPCPRRGPPFPGREGPAPACVCSDRSSPGCWPGWRRPICHLRPCPALATEGLERPPLQEVASPTNPAPRPPRWPPSPAPPLLPAPTGSTAAPAPTLQPAPPLCQARVGVNRLRKEWGGPKPLSVRVHRTGSLASARLRPQGVRWRGETCPLPCKGELPASAQVKPWHRKSQFRPAQLGNSPVSGRVSRAMGQWEVVGRWGPREGRAGSAGLALQGALLPAPHRCELLLANLCSWPPTGVSPGLP